MLIQQINPIQAKEILDQNSEVVYLDVRSVPEFKEGHATGALNIPIFHKTPQGMIPNPEFLKVVEKVLSKEKPLIVGCMMGGRSQKACEALAQAGFSTLYNVQGGYGGSPAQTGWRDLGLPVSDENGEGVSYESLLSR